MSALKSPQWFINPSVDAAQASSIRSLLVATDLSPEARHAVDRVSQLSRQLGATATLLHVDNTPAEREPERRFAPLRRSVISPAHRIVDRMASELAAAHGIGVQAETRRGDVCDQILLMSETADLLSMATKRRNPLHRLVFGSIPGRLLDRCRKPMLLVKQAPRGPYRRVLVLTDFSDESVAAAALAARIAPEAELHLFHAIPLRDETEMRMAEVPASVIRTQRLKAKAAAQIRMDRAMASIGDAASRFAHAFGHGNIVPLALLKQRALDSDLLVVANRTRPDARNFRFWRTARRLSDDCPCDVLVVPTLHRGLASEVSTQAAPRSEQAA